MKSLLIALLVTPSLSLAAEPVLKITDWNQLNRENNRDSAGEVCGMVTGDFQGFDRVLLTVDPGKKQGEYMTFLSPSGKFCHVVASYSGKIQAELIGTQAKDLFER